MSLAVAFAPAGRNGNACARATRTVELHLRVAGPQDRHICSPLAVAIGISEQAMMQSMLPHGNPDASHKGAELAAPSCAYPRV